MTIGSPSARISASLVSVIGLRVGWSSDGLRGGVDTARSFRLAPLVAPQASPHAAWRPLITDWLRPRPLEIPEGFLRVCVLASRRQRPPGRRAYPRAEPLAS